VAKKLRFETRYYRAIPLDRAGYEFTETELEADKTALVVLHCWDIGCEGGPAVDKNFLVGMGSLESFAEAGRILREVIRPAMDAARAAGVLVAHVEHPNIWAKHRSCEAEQDPPRSPSSDDYHPPEAVPGWRQRIVDRSHGKDYATKSPYATMDRAKVAAARADEPMVYQSGQFDRVLRQRGIENLIYTGFAADMCILRAPGGIGDMFGFGYRCYLMRDATVGIEFPDTIEERISTRWAIRFHETHSGDTLESKDFIRACRGA